MATLTFTLTVGAATVIRTKTMTDANANRIITWAQSQYGPLTNAQAFAAMADAMMGGLRENVVSFEKAQAAQTAQNGVATIDVT